MEPAGTGERSTETGVATRGRDPLIVAILPDGEDRVQRVTELLSRASDPVNLQVVIDRDPCNYATDVSMIRDSLYRASLDGSISVCMVRPWANPRGNGAYRVFEIAASYRPYTSRRDTQSPEPILCIFDPRAGIAQSWDTILRGEHARASDSLICCSERNGMGAYSRVVEFDEAGFLITKTVPFFECIPDQRIRAPLPCTCMIAGSAGALSAMCQDATGLLGSDCTIELCQASLLLALSAFRTGTHWELCNRPPTQGCSHAEGRIAQFVHPGFRYMAGGDDTLERYLGVDVEERRVYGQALLGLSVNANVAERLVKLGAVRPT